MRWIARLAGGGRLVAAMVWWWEYRGDGASCELLGSCYADGTGIAKDKRAAERYRKCAAELGYVGE